MAVVAGKTFHYYYGVLLCKLGMTLRSLNHRLVQSIDGIPYGYGIEVVDEMAYYSREGTYFEEVDVEEFEDGIGYKVIAFS